MRSAVGLSILILGATLLCCSSDDEPQATTTPNDGGMPSDDATVGNDSGTGGDSGTAFTSLDFGSGTRLRAQVLEASGVQLFERFRDTKLDMSCTFANAEDGKLRCMPTTEAYDQGMLFADSGCAGPHVVIRQSGCEPLKVVRSGFSTECAVGPGTVRVTLSAATKYWMKNGDACDETPATGLDVYVVGEKVPASELVLGTLEAAKPVADGVGVRKLVADDGAWQMWTPWDVARNAPCTRGGGSGNLDRDRCVPTRIGYQEDFYSDSTCTAVAAYVPPQAPECTAPASAILRQGGQDACGNYEPLYSEVGAQITTTPLYRKSSTTCTEATTTEPTAYYAMGADIPRAALLPLTDSDEGPGPVKLRAIATSSGARVMGTVFFDSGRKLECTALRASDGELRCVPPPVGGTQVELYSDIDCKKPVVRVTAGCAPPSYAQIFKADPTTCKGPIMRYFEIGAKVTPAKVYASFTAGSCTEQAMPAGDLYDASTEIAAASFATMTRKTL